MTVTENEIKQTHVTVVGAGLSGLTAAYLLQKAGLDTLVIEASDRIGGRIHSIRDAKNKFLGDLGPTWVWPPYQPLAAEWLQHFNIETYPQHEEGSAVHDIDLNNGPTHGFSPKQEGISRILGGPQALVDCLATALEPNSLELNSSLLAIAQSDKTLTLRTSQGQINTQYLAITTPLRLATETVDWGDSLDSNLISLMSATPTWMATQAKATIVYERPFWRDKGLSGQIMSRIGPLAETHDHCGPDGYPAAIFGFVGLPASTRDKHRTELENAVIDQLVRCFGPEAAKPTSVVIEDWALSPHVCSKMDLETPPAHPQLLPDTIRESHCNGKLFFACAETASRSPGLVEGALDAGSRAANQILELSAT